MPVKNRPCQPPASLRLTWTTPSIFGREAKPRKTGGAIPRPPPPPSPTPPPDAIILPPKNLQTWFPVNTSKGTKELFSFNHTISPLNRKKWPFWTSGIQNIPGEGGGHAPGSSRKCRPSLELE